MTTSVLSKKTGTKVMTIANTNNLGRAITSLPRTCSHFLVGFCSTVSNHRAKILPADFPLFGPSQQGELTVKLKRVPKLSWLYPQKESWNNQYTSRDTNKVRVLNTCGSCPRVPNQNHSQWRGDSNWDLLRMCPQEQSYGFTRTVNLWRPNLIFLTT